MTKLSDMRLLGEQLAFVESQYGEALKAGEDAAEVDLAASIKFLEVVRGFLRNQNMETGTCDRLMLALGALALGERVPAMLKPNNPDSRPVESMCSERAKGALAAIMDLRQGAADGISYDDSAAWVARIAHPLLVPRLKKKEITERTIKGWYQQYGGKNPKKEISPGRVMYLRTLAAGLDTSGATPYVLGERDLIKLVATIAQKLPA